MNTINNFNINYYKIWAPDNVEWTAWAKPVLFADMDFTSKDTLEIPEAPIYPDFKAMIIIDLPGKQSVIEAIAFANIGYRPVPLYNGTSGSGKMIVNVDEVKKAIFSSTDVLQTLSLLPDSPPVFMLDSNRMNDAKKSDILNGSQHVYDNRWCIFKQDMPSSAFLKGRGITKIIVRTNGNIQTDLERILFDYQNSGITLYLLNINSQTPAEVTIKEQSIINEWAHRLKVIMGLTRNSTGGFGGEIPDPYTSYTSDDHSYRFG